MHSFLPSFFLAGERDSWPQGVGRRRGRERLPSSFLPSLMTWRRCMGHGRPPSFLPSSLPPPGGAPAGRRRGRERLPSSFLPSLMTLRAAAGEGHADVAAQLHAAGARLNAGGAEFLVSAERGNTDIVRTLVAAGTAARRCSRRSSEATSAPWRRCWPLAPTLMCGTVRRCATRANVGTPRPSVAASPAGPAVRRARQPPRPETTKYK